jgi:hypothetical protein
MSALVSTEGDNMASAKKRRALNAWHRYFTRKEARAFRAQREAAVERARRIMRRAVVK